MTTSCMGGWCRIRERCLYHVPDELIDPTERLCTPGHDGLIDWMPLHVFQNGSLSRAAIPPLELDPNESAPRRKTKPIEKQPADGKTRSLDPVEQLQAEIAIHGRQVERYFPHAERPWDRAVPQEIA